MNSLLALSLICGTPTIINNTKVWNAQDEHVFQGAIRECSKSRMYETCLDVFRKRSENVYSFTCRKP